MSLTAAPSHFSTTAPRRSRAARTLVASTAVALAVRLVTMMFVYQDRLDPQRGHWRFGWETGMLARSIALGQGFSSPFTLNTGPSAWMSPLYPGLLAGIFRLFGLFTPASAIAILTFNSLVSALTCIPVYFIARRTAGERTARWAAWIWAFFPYAVAFATTRVWENSLTAFLLPLLVWTTLALAESTRASNTWYALAGLLWAAAALSNPDVLSLFPFALAWLAWRRHSSNRRWLVPVLLTALLLAAGLTPWEIRNYRVFHRPVPLRDNFWMEMRVGNTGDMTDIIPDWAHPAQNPAEQAKFQAMGETAYLAHMRRVSLAFIRRYPGEFVWLSLKRFLYTWTGYWSWNPVYRRDEPFQVPNIFFCTTTTLLMLFGLRAVWRRRRQWAPVFLVPLLIYPAVYYITHPAMEYRHPIDPLIVILIAMAGTTWTGARGRPLWWNGGRD